MTNYSGWLTDWLDVHGQPYIQCKVDGGCKTNCSSGGVQPYSTPHVKWTTPTITERIQPTDQTQDNGITNQPKNIKVATTVHSKLFEMFKSSVSIRFWIILVTIVHLASVTSACSCLVNPNNTKPVYCKTDFLALVTITSKIILFHSEKMDSFCVCCR